MNYTIYCLDGSGTTSIRQDHYEAHRAHVRNATVEVIVSGPLLAKDEATRIGSFFLIEASDLEEAEQFSRSDPFYLAGLWVEVSIRPFLKLTDNRS